MDQNYRNLTLMQLREKRAELVVLNRATLDKIGKTTDANEMKNLEKEWDTRDLEIVGLQELIEQKEKSTARARNQRSLEAELARPVHARRSGRMMGSDPEENDESAPVRPEHHAACLLHGLLGTLEQE